MTVPGHTQVHRKRDSAVASVVTAATAAAAKGPINESIVARLPDILERRCAKSAGLLTLGTPGTGLSGVLERMRGDGSGGRAQTTGGLGAGFGSGVGSMRAQTAGGMLQTLNTGGGREVGRTRPHGGKPMGL